MMGVLPLLPQSTLPNASGGAMMGSTSLTTENGELISFDALFAQSRTAGPDTGMQHAAEGAKAAPAGSFEDLGVILTLLRTSQKNSSAETATSDASATSLEPQDELLAADFAAKNAAPEKLQHNSSNLFVNSKEYHTNINYLVVEVEDLKSAQYLKNAAQHNALRNDATFRNSEKKSDAAAQVARPLIDQMLSQILGQPNAADGDGSKPSLETNLAENLSDTVTPSRNEMVQPDMPRLHPIETPIIGIRMPAPMEVGQKMSEAQSLAQSVTSAINLPAEQHAPNAPIGSLAATSVNAASPDAQTGKATEKMLPPHLAAMIAETTEAPRKPASAAYAFGQMAPQKPEGSDISAHLTPFQRAAPLAASQMAPLTVPANVANPMPVPTDGNAAMQLMFQQTLANGPQHAATLEQSAPTAGLSEHVLDFTSDDAWIDQIAKDIAATKSAAGEISFRLMPRHLGRLDVTMSQNDQGMSVRVEAQHETAASIFAASQTRLVDELRQQGVRVTSTEISHNNGDSERPSHSKDHQNQRPDSTHFIETSAERLPDADHSDKGKTSPRGRFA